MISSCIKEVLKTHKNTLLQSEFSEKVCCWSRKIKKTEPNQIKFLMTSGQVTTSPAVKLQKKDPPLWIIFQNSSSQKKERNLLWKRCSQFLPFCVNILSNIIFKSLFCSYPSAGERTKCLLRVFYHSELY